MTKKRAIIVIAVIAFLIYLITQTRFVDGFIRGFTETLNF